LLSVRGETERSFGAPVSGTSHPHRSDAMPPVKSPIQMLKNAGHVSTRPQIYAPGGHGGSVSVETVGRASLELLELNLQHLERTSPRAAAAVRAAQAAEDVEWVKTGTGALGAARGRGAARVQLCSLRDPVGEGTRFAEAIDLHATGAAVVLGFGLGYHIAACAERMKGLGCVRVFESDVSLLRAVLSRIDIGTWFKHGNVAVHVEPADGADVSAAMIGAEALPMLGTKLLVHPPSKKRLGGAAGEFGRTFTNVVKSIRTNIATTLVQIESTLRNELQNLDHYATRPGILELRDAGRGRPAIIIAAGPSLQRNVHLLKDAAIRDHVVIIAVQTMLKPLLAMGIRPHFVTAIDHHEISRRFYEGLTRADVEGVTLVADSKANPAILSAFPGEIRVFQESTLDRVLGLPQDGGLARDLGELPPGATVAHTAYYLARYLGCDPAVFIGQDLGFTDGQYYSAGAAIHQTWSGELNEFNTLEMLEWQRIARMKNLLRKRVDQMGRPIYTDEQMATYLVQFERDFAADATHGLKTIDASEGGVAKAHTVIRTLASVLEEWTPRVKAMGPMRMPEAKGLDDATRKRTLQLVRERLAIVRAEVREMSRLSRETVELLGEAEAVGLEDGGLKGSKVAELIRRVHANRDAVLARRTGYWLVQFLNQTGTLNRFKADRALKIDADLPECEQQRRRLGRDRDNVRWLLGAAETMERLLDDAAASLDGAAKITRDQTHADQAEGGATRTRSQRYAFLVTADGEFSGLGIRRLVSLGPALRATVAKLKGAKECGRLVVATPDTARTRSELGLIGEGVEIVQVDGALLRKHSRWVGAARLWSRECWRGGVGNMSCFDEVCCPAVLAPVMRELGIDAAAVVGGDWDEINTDLCDQAFARMKEDPERHNVTFVHAAPGVGTCVVTRAVMEELAANPGPFGTLGALLGYIPVAPQADPIAKPACIVAPPELRDLQRRGIADGSGDVSMLRLELRGFDELGQLCELDDEGLARAVEVVRATPGIAVTLEGAGDPALHPRLVEISDELRAAGAAGLHLRTWLTCDVDVVDQLIGRFDMISVELGADDAERFARAMDRVHPMERHPQRDFFELNRANLDLLMTLREDGDVSPCWIVPRIARTDDVYEQLEGLYDLWLMRTGAAVIDPCIPRPGERIAPLPLPRDAAARRLRNAVRLGLDSVNTSRQICGSVR
jgi:hypothetical protein